MTDRRPPLATASLVRIRSLNLAKQSTATPATRYGIAVNRLELMMPRLLAV